jgi:pimeloyl-ACP methyl ester carboxylesterase
VREADLQLSDGRTLHIYDTGAGSGTVPLTVLWHHGTSNTGAPPEPLFEAAAQNHIRWVSYDRPGYGGSTPRPGRDLASAAVDASGVADALGIETFAVMGHSGGANHALACAALLPGRVLAAACLAASAPLHAEGLDWFGGMAPYGAAQLRAAVQGRPALEAFLASTDFDPEYFTPADHAALRGPWSWLLSIVEKAMESGPGPVVDDNLAYVAPWGFDPEQAGSPVLFLHGGQDRVIPSSHGEWLARRCGSAELWARPADGHISVLGSAVAAMAWLSEHAGPGTQQERPLGPHGTSQRGTGPVKCR